MAAPSSLHQRLLRDIAELQAKPYPNIDLRIHDNIREACLILTPDGWFPMHLTVIFGDDYPLRAPEISMQSYVRHPNVMGSYICASILNTEEGYTPAYTLKGIAIQMLSFFGSESLEQDYGGNRNLAQYREQNRFVSESHGFSCTKCGFGHSAATSHDATTRDRADGDSRHLSTNTSPFSETPDDILLEICDKLDDEELLVFARAWSRIGEIITTYNVIRTRELQCFCLKKSFKVAKLGVGVSLNFADSRKGAFESEFDLLSLDAFSIHHVRRSIHNLRFDYWLPLPLTEKHWESVRNDVYPRFTLLKDATGLPQITPCSEVLYRFMNDVVVKLNKEVDNATTNSRSTLKHASEKAIESYFHLFHLLLCLVNNDPGIVNSANNQITAFLNGATSKTEIPDLGHLLIALLISSVPATPDFLKLLVKETITRNVVWMLSGPHPELAFLEADDVSEYRLQHTFNASKTSYRLLLFLNLFRRCVRPDYQRPLGFIRAELFARHGAPPPGTAERFAKAIQGYKAHVNSFPQFLVAMCVEVPTATAFTGWLRESVTASMEKGYSRWAISQDQALFLRLEKEPNVKRPDFVQISIGRKGLSFFPAKPPRKRSREEMIVRDRRRFRGRGGH